MIKNREFRKIADVFQSKLQEDKKIVKQLKKKLFQLLNQQIFAPWGKIIIIGSLGKTLQKHKKQTEGKLIQSNMKQKNC